MTARRSSTCARCLENIEPGVTIVKTQGFGYTHEGCETAPRQAGGDEQLQKVVAFLEAHEDDGNGFYDSLLDQYRTRGTLTERQQAAIIRKIDDAADPLPGPAVVPAGRYAIDGKNGQVVFIHVWRGSRNPTYVRTYADNPDGTRGDQEYPARRTLQAIVDAGPAAAARRYGALTHRCSRCNAELTNATSALLNIGPVCVKHWHPGDHGRIVSDARDLLRELGYDPYKDLPAGVDLEREVRKHHDARLEREQENAAFEAKARRDERLFGEAA
jgi:hypothetical protein